MALYNIYTHIYKTIIHKNTIYIMSCAYRTIKIDEDAIKRVTTYKIIRHKTKNKISRNIKKEKRTEEKLRIAHRPMYNISLSHFLVLFH